MTDTPTLTDRTALIRNRVRALKNGAARFLHDEAIIEVKERLSLVNRQLTKPAVVTGFPEIWADVVAGARIVPDDEVLALEEGAHDLVVHALSLHWANDPVGQLIQARRALRPDGLFLGVMLGGQTLAGLRQAFARAEAAITGGLSPRILPMAEIRDLGGLLQRAGFALPVADSVVTRASYGSPLNLMRDLRAMGEANAMADRNRSPLRRTVLDEAMRLYQADFSENDRVIAEFEMIFLTGWAPDASQQQPLRPGSAVTRLADALGTNETPADDPPDSVRN